MGVVCFEHIWTAQDNFVNAGDLLVVGICVEVWQQAKLVRDDVVYGSSSPFPFPHQRDGISIRKDPRLNGSESVDEFSDELRIGNSFLVVVVRIYYKDAGRRRVAKFVRGCKDIEHPLQLLAER